VPFLGAHLSAAGGVSRAAQAAAACGCQALQLFLRPPGRWQANELPAAEVARFRVACENAGIVGRCFAHAPYLLNLASPDEALRRRSVTVLAEELRLAGTLGLAGVVLHPGSGTGSPRPEAVRRCRDAIAEALDLAGEGAAPLLLEGTAGAGEQLGRTVGELAALVPASCRRQIGICLDTAHLWAAGHDLAGAGWDEVLAACRDHWQRPAPDLLHANDTPVPCGSRRDRHAFPGEGLLGERVFRRLLADPNLAGVPVILEIPPGRGNANVVRALALLRRWQSTGPGGSGRRPSGRGRGAGGASPAAGSSPRR